MWLRRFVAALGLSALLLGGPALGAEERDFLAAVLYSAGGKFDRGFNESIFEGIARFTSETSEAYLEEGIKDDDDRERSLRALVERGATDVIVADDKQAEALKVVAREFPDVRFTIIDAAVADLPNVRSVVFKEEEGSFLVGILAALASKTGSIGFVGGMDIPLIRNFACGYAQGAKHVRPDITVLQAMTGTTPAAWANPQRGGSLARLQFDSGADVVYAAAGLTSLGVYQAAVAASRLAIGVDTNQNYLHPGTMLTSMYKRVDLAAYDSLMDAFNGEWTPGIERLGLFEGAVGYALDQHNWPLMTPEMINAVEAAMVGIANGSIKVVDYRDANACPY
ncbi:MAG: BMP family protein [Alphaproteobacteria bacterium]